ncbi:MAG: hypothetical protein RBU23_02270 [Candidatus Auribacterota bacterium]|jgi:hypothetical protein|nr:hypothetical protein [Candidatus Auribacterota bacterium]
MLGLGDSWVFLAYVLCILSTILCVTYSFVNWNKDIDTISKEDISWLEEEVQVEEEL